jgi:hypothetical protein
MSGAQRMVRVAKLKRLVSCADEKLESIACKKRLKKKEDAREPLPFVQWNYIANIIRLYTSRPGLCTTTRSHIEIRHRVIVSPIFDLLKVSAHMVALVVRPVPLLTLLRVEGEDVNVRETHEVHTKDLDTMI